MTLVLDKLVVPHDLPRPPRPRLLLALAESMTCCASTIVYGRTGTGKTMLATDFVRNASRRGAWYKVDAADAELHVFMQYLVAAVRAQQSGFGRKTLALLATTQMPAAAALLAESFVYETTILEALAVTAQGAADWPRTLQLAQEILRDDQFREDVHCMLLRAHGALGHRGAVKEQYELLRRLLHKELGVEPAAETQKLYRQLTA